MPKTEKLWGKKSWSRPGGGVAPSIIASASETEGQRFESRQDICFRYFNKRMFLGLYIAKLLGIYNLICIVIVCA
jgi:hypothetical protein